MNREEREMDLLWSETTDLRSAVTSIRAEFADLRNRFNLVIVSSALLSLVVGGERLVSLVASLVH